MDNQLAHEVADALGMDCVRVADKHWITMKDGFMTGVIFEPKGAKESAE